jgi:diphthamide synthase/isochorismatase family protein
VSWTLPCEVGPVQPSTHAGLVGGASSSRRSRTTACPAEKTSRKRLIIGGLHTEICLAFAVAQGLKDGYEVMFVTDAVGGRSQTAHRTAIERMSQDGEPQSGERNHDQPPRSARSIGDLFLEDVRAHRERQMTGTGLEPIFPIWGSPTRDLAEQTIASGLRAKLTCIDTRRLAASFAGRELDESFLSSLPGGVDPCGERGEFHSFVCRGPC